MSARLRRLAVFQRRNGFSLARAAKAFFLASRPLGIRRALGAKRRDITQQFLIETVVLSGVGGILGVTLGIAIPQIIVAFIPDQKAFVTPSSVILAFSISVAIGILFGLYPARRAALMDPIEALRHE